MHNAVRKFLTLNHHLALPGIGNFIVEIIPAHIDIANRTILPSSTEIKFSNEKLPAEKFFFNFLARELSTDELQAVRMFTDFTSHLQSDLQENKPVVLKGIGELKKETTNVINFQSEILPQYYPALTAERVIRKNATHTIMVGEQEKTSDEMQTALNLQEEFIREERWWIPAAILAAIGILGIAYYYFVLHPK
jgi:CCDC81-like prokaryotic HU domain 1